MRDAAEQLLTMIMEAHPRLTVLGYASTGAIDNSERAALKSDVAQFERACAWIETHLTPRKTISRRRTSYGLKHIAEPEIGYIRNGVFIAALLACGYTIYVRRSPNPWVAVSEMAVRKAEESVAQSKRGEA